MRRVPSGGGAGACVVEGESSEVVVSGEGMTSDQDCCVMQIAPQDKFVRGRNMSLEVSQ